MSRPSGTDQSAHAMPHPRSVRQPKSRPPQARATQSVASSGRSDSGTPRGPHATCAAGYVTMSDPSRTHTGICPSGAGTTTSPPPARPAPTTSRSTARAAAVPRARGPRLRAPARPTAMARSRRRHRSSTPAGPRVDQAQWPHDRQASAPPSPPPRGRTGPVARAARRTLGIAAGTRHRSSTAPGASAWACISGVKQPNCNQRTSSSGGQRSTNL